MEIRRESLLFQIACRYGCQGEESALWSGIFNREKRENPDCTVQTNACLIVPRFLFGLVIMAAISCCGAFLAYAAITPFFVLYTSMKYGFVDPIVGEAVTTASAMEKFFSLAYTIGVVFWAIATIFAVIFAVYRGWKKFYNKPLVAPGSFKNSVFYQWYVAKRDGICVNIPVEGKGNAGIWGKRYSLKKK